jgi:hypothetical protein
MCMPAELHFPVLVILQHANHCREHPRPLWCCNHAVFDARAVYTNTH